MSFRPEQIKKSFQVLDSTLFTPSAPSRHAAFARPVPVDPEVTLFAETIHNLDVTVNFKEIEEAGIKGVNRLLGQFHQALLTNKPLDARVFDLISELEDLCHQHIEFLGGIIKRAPHNLLDSAVKVHDALVNERNCWRLIGCLYNDRLQSTRNSDIDLDLDLEIREATERTIVNKLYDSDHELRQFQLVVDWLEKNAADQLNSYYERVEFFQDRSVAFENTLRTLEHDATARPTITNLDLDASVRQNKPIHDLDREDNERLNRDLFLLLRCGQLDKATRLCLRVGQPWKAATLQGWQLYHDPNFNGSELEDVQGNPYRDVWRMIAWGVADDVRLSLWERGVFAVLSGHLDALLPVCKDWESALWAYCKVLIDNRVEKFIRLNHHVERPLAPLPDAFSQTKLTPNDIFRELSANHPSETLYHLVQRHVILDDPMNLMELADRRLEMPENRVVQIHHRRFLAHVALVLGAFGKLGRSTIERSEDEPVTQILQKYVQTLIELREKDLIATYTAVLPGNLQVSCYAQFLRSVRDIEEKHEALQLAIEAGLDIDNITSTLVQSIRQENVDVDLTNVSISANTELDDEKVESIEWLLIKEDQRAEALRQGNAIIRQFLIQSKLQHATQLFHKIPTDSVSLAIKQVSSTTTFDGDAHPKLSNTIREYLCHQAYLYAMEAFGDWMERFHKDAPVEPKRPREGAPFPEQVAWEHKVKQYEAEKVKWEDALQHYTQTAYDCLYNVLLFPDGGWLVDSHEDPEPELNRQQELLAVRCLIIPQVVSLLHKMHFLQKEFSKCLQIADLVASQEHQIYQVFSKEEMKRFCEKKYEASKALLTLGQGALGFLR